MGGVPEIPRRGGGLLVGGLTHLLHILKNFLDN